MLFLGVMRPGIVLLRGLAHYAAVHTNKTLPPPHCLPPPPPPLPAVPKNRSGTLCTQQGEIIQVS
jgi:hypothetical protein